MKTETYRHSRNWCKDGADVYPINALADLREKIISRTAFSPYYVLQQRTERFCPRTNFYHSDTEYTLIFELPGLKKDEITLLVEENCLKVKGEKRHLEIEGRKIFSEQLEGKFSRVIPLQERIDVESVSAKLENGILIIKAPKLSPPVPGSRAWIDIDSE